MVTVNEPVDHFIALLIGCLVYKWSEKLKDFQFTVREEAKKPENLRILPYLIVIYTQVENV